MTAVSDCYCTATVIREVDPWQAEPVSLDSFVDLLVFLRQTYNWFADFIADQRAEEGKRRPDEEPIGGFGVTLRNRWKSELEVGIGRDLWFLMRLQPEPRDCFSDQPDSAGPLGFFLSGWHYTPLSGHLLVSRRACLAGLRRWLDSNEFPGAAARA
jgi:hypothetical protein